MKKILLLTIIALSLSACGSQTDTHVNEALENDKQIASRENPAEENTENEDEEINRTYPEDKKEEIKKEVIDVENSADEKEKEDEKDSKDEDEKPSDKDDKKDKKDKKDEKKEDKKDDKEGKDSDEDNEGNKKEKKVLTEDDYFFSYFDLVSVKDGKIVDALKELGYNTTDVSHEKEYTASYVPYSNNVFVLGSYPKNDFSIQRIDGKKLTLLHDFKENESFIPLGIVGDKVYGMYAYYENNERIADKSGFGVVDLKTGNVGVYKATKSDTGESLIGVGVSDKEAVFTKFEKENGTNLYKLDFEKGFDQEAELIEENTEANFVMSAKHFDKDKPVYEIFTSKGNDFLIGDEKYPVTDTNRISFIGQNMIIQEPVKFDLDETLFKMDIINYLTGEVIEKDLESLGYRVYNGKLYYIDYDKKVQSLEIGL